MNPTPTLEKEPELDAASVVAIPLNNPKPVRENPLKTWIKKIPFFPAMDYFPRKVYDSSLFDASVRPLAKLLKNGRGHC